MNKFGIIAALMALLLSTSALAYVDVTYHFNVPDVEVSAYNINNADGSSVSAFSGSFPDGTSTSDGELTIRFPNSLASPYGYAIYYVSPGYLPLEAVATWHTFGNPQAFYQDFDLQFSKLSDCRAVIDEFTITNEAYANVPVVVNMQAGLDATLLSAFSLTDNQLAYVPPQYADEYYSADIEVTLRIYNSADMLVNTQTQSFTVFADEYEDVSFTWTPSLDGQYRAVITTEVVDDQCSSDIPGQSEKTFTVLDSLPQNECYTIINGLYALPEVPTVGDTVDLHITKISNHANNVPYGSPGYALTPIATELTTTVRAPSGIIFQDTEILAANSNNFDAEEYVLSVPVSEPGKHTITVSGKGSSSLCTGLSNPTETAVLQTYVKAEAAYMVTFQLSDAVLGTKVEGAVVNMDGQYLATDENGIVSFSELEPGTYAYVITHPDYETLSGTVTVTDSDQFVFLTLQPGDGEDVPVPEPEPEPEVEDEAEFGIHIDTIRIDDAFTQTGGNDVPVRITFENDGDKKMRHVKATVLIQELGVRASIGPFDLKSGDERSETLFLPLDAGIEPGVYSVRITLHSDEVNRVVYREIEVVE